MHLCVQPSFVYKNICVTDYQSKMSVQNKLSLFKVLLQAYRSNIAYFALPVQLKPFSAGTISQAKNRFIKSVP